MSKRYLYPHVYCSIIQNSQDLETTKCPLMDEGRKKIREEKGMADPADHAGPANSAAMAGEHEEYENKIAQLMEKWEQLMEAMEE